VKAEARLETTVSHNARNVLIAGAALLALVALVLAFCHAG